MKTLMFVIPFAVCNLLQAPASASYFLVCKVTANIDFFSEETETYGLIIQKAVVQNGHEEIGEPCPNLQKGQEIEIDAANIGTDLPYKEDATFLYHYYNGKGAEGVVESHEWKLWED